MAKKKKSIIEKAKDLVLGTDAEKVVEPVVPETAPSTDELTEGTNDSEPPVGDAPNPISNIEDAVKLVEDRVDDSVNEEIAGNADADMLVSESHESKDLDVDGLVKRRGYSRATAEKIVANRSK